jgi:AcrR family transcriptional regulator
LVGMYKDEDNGEGRTRRTQAERRASTRRAFVDAARGLFAEKGYGGVTIGEIVVRTGMTKGALYHHFEDKRSLLRAVVEEIEEELDEEVLGAARKSREENRDPFGAFMAGIHAYLDACLRQDVRQILLLDGPSVLGWEEWHGIDAEHAIAQIEGGLKVLMDLEVVEAQPIGPLAHLIHGATMEAALFIATADDPGKAREEMGSALRRLLEGL